MVATALRTVHDSPINVCCSIIYPAIGGDKTRLNVPTDISNPKILPAADREVVVVKLLVNSTLPILPQIVIGIKVKHSNIRDRLIGIKEKENVNNNNEYCMIADGVHRSVR